MTIDDYIEGDQYDWDQSDNSQYCQHGTFIGSWWGPDILCQWCEDGISVKEMREMAKAARRREIAKLLDIEQAVRDVLPFSGRYLHWWVHVFAPSMLNGARIFEMSDWEVT